MKVSWRIVGFIYLFSALLLLKELIKPGIEITRLEPLGQRGILILFAFSLLFFLLLISGLLLVRGHRKARYLSFISAPVSIIILWGSLNAGIRWFKQAKMSFTNQTALTTNANRTSEDIGANEPKVLVLNPGSIGIVRLKDSSLDTFIVEVFFPRKFLPQKLRFPEKGKDYQGDHFEGARRKIQFQRRLVLLDGDGTLYKTEIVQEVELKLWCFNDGGPQFSPFATVIIPKTQIKKNLKPVGSEKIIGFALIENDTKPVVKALDLPKSAKVLLSADLNGDKVKDIALFEETGPSGAQFAAAGQLDVCEIDCCEP